MKDLLYKEFKLATHPTTFIFLAFSMMLLIPSYPYYVIFFYTALSLFFVFLTGRENKDIFYTVSLPIRKRDAVKARCWMAAFIELVQVLLAVPFAVLSAAVNPKGNLAGIDANAAFFGLVFLMLAVFNLIFIPTFYKTAYKVGTAFLAGSIFMAFYVFFAEALVWIPSPVKDYLDTTAPGTLMKQTPVLIAGFAIWVLSMFPTYRISASNFEKVDL